MKLLLLGSLLFSGGSAVAMQNETVKDEVSNMYNQAKQMVQKGFKGSMVDRVKESGFPYPNETQLAKLTDEQEAILVSTIDQINATYDWANMTDEEILLALQDIKVELDALRTELGIEPIQDRIQAKIQQRTNQAGRKGNHWNEEFVPNGDGTQDGDCPLDDVTPVDPETDVA